MTPKEIAKYPEWVFDFDFFIDFENKIPYLSKILDKKEANMGVKNEWCVIEQLTAEHITEQQEEKTILCWRWGKCTAMLRCPLEKKIRKYRFEKDFDITVLNRCAGLNDGIVRLDGD